MVVKINWIRYTRKNSTGIWLRIPTGFWDHPDMRGFSTKNNINIDEYLTTIQEWSVETNCGVRQSYDMWQFKTEGEVIMFLLRWS